LGDINKTTKNHSMLSWNSISSNVNSDGELDSIEIQDTVSELDCEMSCKDSLEDATIESIKIFISWYSHIVRSYCKTVLQ